MPEQSSQFIDAPPSPTEAFGSVPHNAEGFGNVPHATEGFRKVPQAAESQSNAERLRERTEDHTLTVREVARLFEEAKVARSERSIVNWCQPNRTGIARLDAYFDPNDRKYFITPLSVERAIEEEKARIAQRANSSETFGNVPQQEESTGSEKAFTGESDPSTIRELEKEVMDLKITNRAKDFFIQQLQEERKAFAVERKDYVEQLISSNRRVGELETHLKQISAPRGQDQ